VSLELPIVTAARPHPDTAWLKLARRARLLSWLSLLWMTLEGVVGVAAGLQANSISILTWAASSAVEGLASAIVIWRFTGARTHSETSERTAQRAVAVSFFLLAPYIAVEAIRALAGGEHPDTSPLGIAITASSVVLMPALGVAKRRLGARLGSGATAGEGTQNLLCAAQGAAVLAGLAANAAFGAWWLDAAIALALAAIALNEGRDAWRGEGCCTGDCCTTG
jgi:divalent metal cation (Fe/Co/Zn/Cd) transporter